MLRAYTVCTFCFKNLEHGSRCECAGSQGKPQILAVRYTEAPDSDSIDSSPSILGRDGWDVENGDMVVPGTFVGAKVVLAPEVQLCEGCQADFQQACEWIAEIINNCMTLDGSKCSEDSEALIGKKIIKE